MTTTSTSRGDSPRQRVPAAQRRDALIEAATHEFAHGGLHGTPVDRIARRVGVAQPYVFSLFGSKRELFLAAVDRCFEIVAGVFTKAVAEFEAEGGPAQDELCKDGEYDVFKAMGNAYVQMLEADRDLLMLQHHAYAACDDEVIRERVRRCYARLVGHVQALTGADSERLDEFFRYGMWLNVAAAMGVEDLSAGCEWMRADQQELDSAQQ
jgi:AcrR family transcriptional regulator